MNHDVLIVGGGPAGLSAALMLGRARKNVLMCDLGPRRNGMAEHIHNFVTRDGVSPDEFRRTAREQLQRYPNVELRQARVESISGVRGDFSVRSGTDVFRAKRIILCPGMIDEPLSIDGFKELWGHAIYQCPYCHGWEVKERPWGFIASSPETARFAVLLRSWTREVTMFTQERFEISTELHSQLSEAGVRLETTPIARLRRKERTLIGLELSDGRFVRCEALYAHPPQRHVKLVKSLGLTLDEGGFVQVEPMSKETSTAGIYAAGDLTTRAQGAIFAAATGAQAAGMLNHELTADMAAKKLL